MNSKKLHNKVDAFIKKIHKDLFFIDNYHRILRMPRHRLPLERTIALKAVKILGYSKKTRWQDVIDTLLRRYRDLVNGEES